MIPETEDVVGLVSEQEIEDCTAYWIQIAGEQHFLGCTLEAANLTAEQGDWIRLGLNGRLLPDDFAWFEQRAKLGSDWLSKETSLQREERRVRILFNTELTNPILNVANALDATGTTENANQSKMRPLLYRVVDDLLCLEILRIEGKPGYWVFDQQFELYRRINLNLGHNGFNIQVDTTCPIKRCSTEAEQDLAAKLMCDDDYELVRLELFRDGKSSLTVHASDDGHNEVTMLKLE